MASGLPSKLEAKRIHWFDIRNNYKQYTCIVQMESEIKISGIIYNAVKSLNNKLEEK